MPLQAYNTLTRKKEPFKPLTPGKITMYLCGPTVYDFAHLGHGRSAVAFDVIRRYLEYVYGEKNVTFVSNYTDVDDKMINRANQEKITVKELADRIIPEYQKDYEDLGVKPATIQTKATEYIPQMIEIVQLLEKKGFAYNLNGDLYFEIEKFKNYGKLSKQNQKELLSGARVTIDEKKKHPQDFALWKSEKPGEPSWDSPWGKGRPGWHIECSAMSRTNLGQPFDIHGGGMDLIFPHHEDEIAQSEAAYDVPFCTTWLHNGFVTLDKEKMSKSLGNFFTLKDIFKQFRPQAVRYFFLTAHYRNPIEFNKDQLAQAENSLKRLQDFLINLTHYKTPDTKSKGLMKPLLQTLKNDFEAAMDDDFDTVRALAALFTFVKEINKGLTEKAFIEKETQTAFSVLQKFDSVLNILPKLETQVTDDVEALITERNQARAAKNWKRSDEIRDLLLNQGIVLEDTPQGTLWKKTT
ncbi:MAG: cysteine--tRNA ligase [Candidatus Gracilibacteria bacterium]